MTVEGHTVVEPLELSISSAWVNWNGNNITLEGSGLSWSKTMTGLAEGNYNFRVYANDTYDNSNTTEERTITVSKYDILFNITSANRPPLDLTELTFTCPNTAYTDEWTGLSNPPSPYKFFEGSYSCTFSKDNFFDETVNLARKRNMNHRIQASSRP